MPQGSISKRPEPRVDADSRHFWEGVRQKELRLQRCDYCGQVRFYSRYLCPHCWSSEYAWILSSGQGEIYTFSVVHRGPPAFADLVPYLVVLVKLDEGPMIMGNMPNEDPGGIRIGHRVTAIYPESSDQRALIHFALA